MVFLGATMAALCVYTSVQTNVVFQIRPDYDLQAHIASVQRYTVPALKGWMLRYQTKDGIELQLYVGGARPTGFSKTLLSGDMSEQLFVDQCGMLTG
jgi:hypothetical protein